MERESRNLEYKLNVTKSYLKTVSAYANYGGGRIIFGVDDNRVIIGLDYVHQVCLNIENQINDNLNPVPEYTLRICDQDIIVLEVEEGKDKPYYYQNKAYRRNDSATIEVGRLELNRLILEGLNQSYDEQPARNQELHFSVLEEELKKNLSIDCINSDILKTLELMNHQEVYNQAAYLLSDDYAGSGIDIVRFGANINQMIERQTLDKGSILAQFDQALKMFRRYYEYEEIKGFKRECVELIPEEAFREAVANALAHRCWDVPAHIRISMYQNHIEIVSPGTLPEGISKKDYLERQISLLRNPILGNVLFRLNYIERFGTGIHRINKCYQGSESKPQYHISESVISVSLPLLHRQLDYSVMEQKVIDYMRFAGQATRKELEEKLEIEKSKLIRVLNHLIELNKVVRTGTGRATKYHYQK